MGLSTVPSFLQNLPRNWVPEKEAPEEGIYGTHIGLRYDEKKLLASFFIDNKAEYFWSGFSLTQDTYFIFTSTVRPSAKQAGKSRETRFMQSQIQPNLFRCDMRLPSYQIEGRSLEIIEDGKVLKLTIRPPSRPGHFVSMRFVPLPAGFALGFR